MQSQPDRWLNADEQIAEVRDSLDQLRSAPRSPERDQELRDAQAYLDQLLALRARGELEPLGYEPPETL